MASANAIKHYKSSLITVKRHAMVLSFLKANLVVLLGWNLTTIDMINALYQMFPFHILQHDIGQF